MSPDKLVYMANQIGRYFAHQPPEQAVESIADHLLKFWDPRMRKAMAAHFDETGGAGLDPAALSAVRKVRDHDRRKAEAQAGQPPA